MIWQVYELLEQDGTPFYVGVSCNVKRRLKEHRTALRRKFGHGILQTYPDEDSARDGEIVWINHHIDAGHKLTNRMRRRHSRTRLTHGPEARRKLSEAGRGKAKPEGFGKKISAILKGRPHDVSESGRAAMAQTQFKAGQGRFADLSPEVQELRRDQRRRLWDGIPAEERTRLARERNLKAWAARTPEQRAEIGRRISAAKKAKG